MFRLLRYFSIISAVALLVVALALYQLYRYTALEELVQTTEQQSSMLTHSLANAIWPGFRDIARLERGVNPEIQTGYSRIGVFHRTLLSLIDGLPVLKIKIYNLEGATVYSTVVSEIGEARDEPIDPKVVVEGRETASGILHEHEFASVLGHREHRFYVETFLPIRDENDRVEGVFELYTDVSQRVAEIEGASRLLLAGLLALFALLYAGLYVAVRYANGILTRQYRELEESRADIRAKNDQLEDEIVRRGESESALRDARDQAEAANKAKSQFLANMSHELRTPLNAVIGFSEVIADEVFGRVTPSRYRDYASDIRKSGRHLLALVNDVLDLARIEAGTMPSELGSVKVAGLVRGIVRAAKSDLADHGNTLVLSCPRTVGEMVTDEKKLRSVLTNLIGNAAKFTRDGRIEVEVGREESQGRSWVVVRVSDTGIGMETDRAEEMFGEFTQQNPSIAKRFGGAGLGLAISRRFCESLGGGISVDSAPGEGVTMTVRLPDMADAQEASEVSVARQLRSTG